MSVTLTQQHRCCCQRIWQSLLMPQSVVASARAVLTCINVSAFDGPNMCLDFAVDSAPPEALADCLRCKVGCFAKARGIARLDLIS
jgi:hypothetical protein